MEVMARPDRRGIDFVDVSRAILQPAYKRRQSDGRIRLEPANRTMKLIVVDRAEIRGVVVSVIRRL